MFQRVYRLAVLIGATMAISLPALALSCQQPTPESSFQFYDAAPNYYQIFEGSLQPLQPVPNTPSYTENPNPVTVMYRFTGTVFGQGSGRYRSTESFDVAVTPQCAGPWCASYPNQDQQIYFFGMPTAYDGGYHTYKPGACPGSHFDPVTENRKRLRSCLNGHCQSQPPISVPPQPRPPEPPIAKDRCGATYLTGIVGLRADALPAMLKQNRHVRIIRPGDIVTKDYRLERLNIDLDAGDYVIALRCG